jgi:glycosyltransferase 2 family protein
LSPRTRRLLLSGLVGAVLLFIFFKGMDWKAVGQAFRRADPVYMAGVVAATLAVYALRAWRWGYLLRPLADVPFSRLFSVTLLGFASGLVVPRAGEVLRPYLVARHHSLRTSAAFATIILERLVDLITVLILFGLYLYVLPLPDVQQRGPLLTALKVAGGLAALVALVALGLLIVLHVAAGRILRVLDRVFTRMPRRIGPALSRALQSFGEGLAVLQAPGSHLLAMIGQSLVLWGAICLGIHWTNLAFGIHLPFHATFLIVGFLTVGVAVPTPGMVGGFHVAYLQALTQNFGVDPATAGAAGIASHALTNLPVLFLGLFFLWREGLTFGRIATLTDSSARGPQPPGAPALPEGSGGRDGRHETLGVRSR